MDYVYSSKPKTIAKFYMFEDGTNKVFIEMLDDSLSRDDIEEMLVDNEFIYGDGGKRLSINNDGYEFLNNLKVQFSGSAIRCGEIDTELV